MAVYFGRNEVIDPLLDATDITDTAQTALRLSGSTQGNLPIDKARQITITPLQTALPLTSDPHGLYSVQTGANRGFYINTGTDIVQVAAYPNDGSWPV